jgi:hypothetical protein
VSCSSWLSITSQQYYSTRRIITGHNLSSTQRYFSLIINRCQLPATNQWNKSCNALDLRKCSCPGIRTGSKNRMRPHTTLSPQHIYPPPHVPSAALLPSILIPSLQFHAMDDSRELACLAPSGTCPSCADRRGGAPPLCAAPVRQGEGPKRRTREGEWIGADKNSILEFGLWTRFHSCTSTSFSCQAHATTGVLLDLEARPNQQPLDTRSRNTNDTAAGTSNRSGRFLKPIRPLLLDLASHRQGKPVRPIWQTGQVGFVQKLPKTPLRLKTPQESFLLWTKEAIAWLKASRPLIRVLVINDNHYGLTFLFEL